MLINELRPNQAEFLRKKLWADHVHETSLTTPISQKLWNASEALLAVYFKARWQRLAEETDPSFQEAIAYNKSRADYWQWVIERYQDDANQWLAQQEV